MNKIWLTGLVAVGIAVGCGGLSQPTDLTVDGSVQAQNLSPDTLMSCSTDFDCMDAGLPTNPHGYLCYGGFCQQACLSTVNSGCPKHKSCVILYTDAGNCYRQPGCNPPPPGILCPFLCYGICK